LQICLVASAWRGHIPLGNCQVVRWRHNEDQLSGLSFIEIGSEPFA
jgi:hypothetical protein